MSGLKAVPALPRKISADLFYQAQRLPWQPIEVQDEWNRCKYVDAHVIHWHSSRHSPTKLECMRQVNEALNVPLLTEFK